MADISKIINKDFEAHAENVLRESKIEIRRLATEITPNNFYYFSLGWFVCSSQGFSDFYYPVLFFCREIICLNPTSLIENDDSFTMYQFEIIRIKDSSIVETVNWQKVIVEQKLDKQSFNEVRFEDAGKEAKLRLLLNGLER